MNSYSSGSFCILGRYFDAVQRRPEPERQTAVTHAFLSKYSTDIRERVLFCRVVFAFHMHSPKKVFEVIAKGLGLPPTTSLPQLTQCHATHYTYVTNSVISIQEIDDFLTLVETGSPTVEQTRTFLTSLSSQDLGFFVGVLLQPSKLHIEAILKGWKTDIADLYVSVGRSMPKLCQRILGAEGDDDEAIMSPALSPTAEVGAMNEEDDDGYASPTPVGRLSFRAEAVALPPPTETTSKRSRDDEDCVAHGGAPLKPMCKYGASCYRKNKEHREQFSHPDDGAPTTTTTPTATPPTPAPAPPITTLPPPPTTKGHPRAINGVMPLNLMPEDEIVYVDGGEGGYKMKYTANMYYCTCPVWRFQNKSVNERTCKHLQAYLGSEFDALRIGGGAPSVKTGVPSEPMFGTHAATASRKVAMKPLLLANKASDKADYTGWWISEKLDGVRAFWDGTTFLSRNGNTFSAPDWFTKSLPTPAEGMTCDGELFGGRNLFQSTVGIVKSSSTHSGWKTLKYEIFDVPSHGHLPFEQRHELLLKRFGSGYADGTYHHVVEQIKCTGKAHIDAELTRVEKLSGEGLMLRRPLSVYEHCRSNTLLKVKTFCDVDAIVRGYDFGKGKNTGLCGALICELDNGKRFNVGSGLTDALRHTPPPVGSIVIVKYQNLTVGGIPRFPTYLGVRADGVWPPAKKAKRGAGDDDDD